MHANFQLKHLSYVIFLSRELVHDTSSKKKISI